MFKNCFYDSRKSMIHLWEQVNGRNLYNTYHWVPYVFKNSDDGEVKTITGLQASKVLFSNYSEYYNTCKDSVEFYENKVNSEIQFLSERYNGISDDEIDAPKLRVYSIDIEVNSEKSFPTVYEAKHPVVLVSVYDNLENKTTVFGSKPYNGKYKDRDFLTYVHCKDESTLLISLFNHFEMNPCDVISGYNCQYFDLAYLINRSKVLFGENTDIYKKLSPIKVVRTWVSQDSKDMNIDITGVTILDYLDLYKWYSPTKLESYKLDFVCKYELEKGKVDYSEYKDLRTLYSENWDLYVEYNIIDAYRVAQLEEKLGYIKLVQALSLLCKTPMKFYHTMTQLIEGLMLTHFRRNNLCAPTFFGGTQETFEAAYVKEPQVGRYDWVVDFDIASSYPTAIITLNMSPETQYGRIIEMTEEQVMFYTTKREFPVFKIRKDRGIVTFDGKKLEIFNAALQKKLLCIAPCGTVFSTRQTGVIAEVEKKVFEKRIEIKNKMIKMKKNLSELRGKNLDKTQQKIDQFHSLQHALKIVLNAVFGTLAVPFSRYFNIDIAEAIVSCGRQTIKKAEKYVNDLLNSPTSELLLELSNIDTVDVEKIKNQDFIIYCDTDSLYLNVGMFFDIFIGKDWRGFTDDVIITHILNITKYIENYLNDKAYRDIQRKAYNSPVTDFRIKFKQEVIAKSALFVKKKKYSLWHVNEEGAPVDKIKTTGLEIIRSETPESVRPMLRDLMEMILKNNSDKDIRDRIIKNKKELSKIIPEEIAVNIGIHDLDKYIDENNKCAKGTPMHVKGVANYRALLKNLKLENQYEEIETGAKVKVVYLKKNQFGYDVMSFNRWPKEFDKVIQVDITKMIEKQFIGKIKTILKPMEKQDLIDDTISTLGTFFK